MMNPLQWVAYYGDEVFPQYNPDGTENRYQDIDRDRLTAFALVKDGNLVTRVHFEAGMRLIYRRRVAIRAGDKVTVCYLVGWQKTENGVNSQAISCVFEHGGPVEIIPRWTDGMFNAPELLPFEQEHITSD